MYTWTLHVSLAHGLCVVLIASPSAPFFPVPSSHCGRSQVLSLDLPLVHATQTHLLLSCPLDRLGSIGGHRGGGCDKGRPSCGDDRAGHESIGRGEKGRMLLEAWTGRGWAPGSASRLLGLVSLNESVDEAPLVVPSSSPASGCTCHVTTHHPISLQG